MDEIIINREKIEKMMQENALLILFAGQPPQKRGDERYPFAPDRNFYYLTGIDRPGFIFLLYKTEEGRREVLFLPRGNEEETKWIGSSTSKEEAAEQSGLSELYYVDEFYDFLTFLMGRQVVHTCYLEIEQQQWEAAPSPACNFCKELRDRYPDVSIAGANEMFAVCRQKKDFWEIQRIQKAVAITVEGIKTVMKNAKAGMFEYELEAWFDFVCKQNGVKQLAFATICAAGARAATLHYTENDQEAKAGELVLLDAGAQWKWYNGDLTRTFPVGGVFSPLQKEFYQIVLTGQELVLNAVKPNVTLEQLEEIIKRYYFQELSARGMIQDISEVSKYYFHRTCHLLGAETHDITSKGSVVLEEGMVLTVEPGLYLPQYQLGIRIEDDVLVTKNGCNILSKDLPKTVEEIEGFMAEN